MYHADGIYSSECRTCRKDVFRLLKDDLAKFYDYNKLSNKNFCSYFMKTIILHMYEEKQSWAAENFRRRYVEALQRTIFYLDAMFLDHYFIEGANILSEKNMSDGELTMIKEYFYCILKYYNR